MYCEFCLKECKNKNSLKQHEVRCKSNPNKIKIVSNWIHYNKEIKNGIRERKNANQFTKAKNLGLPKIIVSKETRTKISNANKNKIWTNEQKLNLSLAMIEATIKYPESYSANNVCGRTKLIEVEDSFGNIVKVNGGWEKLVADYLNVNNIKWTNKIEEKIYYYWNGLNRIYYPDFYLPDYNKYIEVKGYQRERDLIKWEVIKNRLIIIKQKEINEIKNNTYIIKITNENN